MHSATMSVVNKIVTGVLDALGDCAYVNASFTRQDYKEREIANVWLGEDDTYETASRVAEITVFDCDRDDAESASLSLWDRQKNEAETGMRHLAVWTPETITADSAIAFLLS